MWIDSVLDSIKSLTISQWLLFAGALAVALIAWKIIADIVDTASIPSIIVSLTASEFEFFAWMETKFGCCTNRL